MNLNLCDLVAEVREAVKAASSIREAASAVKAILAANAPYVDEYTSQGYLDKLTVVMIDGQCYSCNRVTAAVIREAVTTRGGTMVNNVWTTEE